MLEKFHWLTKPPASYAALTHWARQARNVNPLVFDELSAWVLDDNNWSPETLNANMALLTTIIDRFKAQNALIREFLTKIKDGTAINEATFPALDRFDAELRAERMFADPSALLDKQVRAGIGGGLTGPTGTNSVETFGYINELENWDAQVQWTLFMPDLVQQQQQGFRLASFEYLKLPALKLVGFEGAEDLAEMKPKLHELAEKYASDFPYDVCFIHHGGQGVDVAPPRFVFGRLLRPEAPVPEGFVSIDLVPTDDGLPGAPYVSQFAFAKFEGDEGAMNRPEGWDVDGMYDVTRNIILGQNVNIPYPYKYWTAEVYLNGLGSAPTAYLFSVIR